LELFKLEYNPVAMARLALGSSCTIATLLCLPDAFALIPNAPTATIWFVRLLGLWLTAFILWFCGFLATLYVGRFLGGPIVVGADGIKLWRMGRKVNWANVKAVGVEKQDWFARIFCLKPPIYRLTLYIAHGRGINQVNIPSFPFLKSEFASLVAYVLKSTLHALPDSLQFTVFQEPDRQELKKTCERTAKMRIVLSMFIAIGLVMYFGRRAGESYEYNLGSREFKAARYELALKHFRKAVAIDPAFTMGWDRLGQTEYQLGQMPQAEEHWHKALFFKPDLVDSKLGLARIYIDRKEFSKAEQLLEQCVRLSPHNMTVYLNLCRLAALQGHERDAKSYLNSAIAEGDVDVNAYIAGARLADSLGMKAEAMQLVRKALSIDSTNANAISLSKQFEGGAK
jgi:tetratricopeptide (TPR) repeat protein